MRCYLLVSALAVQQYSFTAVPHGNRFQFVKLDTSFMIMKRVTVKMPDDLHKDLKIKAVTEDISLNQLILDAVRIYLKNVTDKQ